jgi:hypothetical protein
MFCAGALLAQDAGEKATVPLQDPSRAPLIHVHLIQGGITVRGADRADVLVEAHARAHQESSHLRSPRADGMKRLDLPGNSGLDVTEENNVINVRTDFPNRTSDLTLLVPRHSSLELKCTNDGDINVEQLNGEIDAEDVNGSITLKDISGSVVANSVNGAVTVSLDRIDAAKPMSFSTLNGDIDVTLPDSLRANVRLKTDHGDIFSDFEVKLEAQVHVSEGASGRQKDGTYHLRFDRTLRGTINGGGPEFQFTTFNGQIYLRKKK